MMQRVFLILSLAVWCAAAAGEQPDHWSFRHLAPGHVPAVKHARSARTPIDYYILSKLEERGLAFGAQTDRATLLRRLSFDLTGLPPTPAELAAFCTDEDPQAYARVVERLLASPRYGERWGKIWLDAAGYADSNGYFNADTDRPLAHKYRDYVIRAFNNDKPYDQFVREQLAGDELAGYSPSSTITPRMVELLTATHFLRNAQDGSSESDGNPDEVTIDRATVLEGTLQITMNTLLGITIQCARCHEHKFEPIEQAEYYQLQSVFYPAFPFFHRDKWVGPVQRINHVASAAELAAWEASQRRIDNKIASVRQEFAAWITANRPPSTILFQDDFDAPDAKVAATWSNTAPEDDAPGGTSAVNVDSDSTPGARIRHGTLELAESGAAGNRWLSTKQAIDWTPDKKGEWVQVTFDLVSDKIAPGGSPAARIGYYLALHDFDDSSPQPGGNILIDGNPAGGAAVHLDYPGDDAKSAGSIGTSGYEPRRNYGVRVTNVGNNQFRLEQLVDWSPEEKSVTLNAADLPDGGFGFEFCCGRSFVVDNVVVEGFATKGSTAEHDRAVTIFLQEYEKGRKKRDDAVAAANAERAEKPGKLAWVSDLVSPAPDVHLLERGLYSQPGETVQPSGLAMLTDDASHFRLPSLPAGVASSGRRLAFANWLSRPGSRPAALLARVMANRVWLHHFGTGLVTTADNFGESGEQPSHPQLVDYLAAEFVRSGWSMKALHRLIVNSAVYQQSSAPRDGALQIDPDNRLLWRFPLRRLDAEAVRDAMLIASAELDERLYGPYVATQVLGDGNVVVDEKQAGARRRGVYLQQRRTRMNSLLMLFDAPAMVSTCGQRNTSTVPLQSLALLNSSFVRNRSAAMASRITQEVRSDDTTRINRAFALTFGREPESHERSAAIEFLSKQQTVYQDDEHARQRALRDLCQMLFASNAFLYIE